MLLKSFRFVLKSLLLSRQKRVGVCSSVGLASFSRGRQSCVQPVSKARALCIWCLCARVRPGRGLPTWLQSHSGSGPVLCRGLSPPWLESCLASERDGSEGRQDLVSVWTAKTIFFVASFWLCTRLGLQAAGRRSAAPPVRTLRRARWPTGRRSVCGPGRDTGGAPQRGRKRAVRAP